MTSFKEKIKQELEDKIKQKLEKKLKPKVKGLIKQHEKRLNEKQLKFIEYYTDVKSPTFNNCVQSGVRAGFTYSYASDLLNKGGKWITPIIDRITDEKRLRKAERNIEEVLDMDIRNGGDKVDPAILATRTKVDFYITERLDKLKYSTRTENATIVKHIHEIDEETKARLDNLLQ